MTGVQPRLILLFLGALGVLAVHQTQPAPAQVLPTPSVLLPGNFWEELRTPLAVGTTAPDFALPLAADSRWKLPVEARVKPVARDRQYSVVPQPDLLRPADLHTARRGTKPGVRVIIFWAFWCDTWKDVTRDLKRVRSQLDETGAAVACIAVDASQQPVARTAFASGDIWYPVVIDTDSKVTELYGVRRVPTIFLIDNANRIRACYEGFPGPFTLLKAVQAAAKPHQSSKPKSRSTAVTAR